MTGKHIAAYFGLREVMVAFLKRGDHLDLKDTSGRTPLSWVAGEGHEGIVQLLIARDCVDPDSRDTEYGLTPLSRAAENGHRWVVKLLLALNGVDPNSMDHIIGHRCGGRQRTATRR
jgi:ankyrin repeat protein